MTWRCYYCGSENWEDEEFCYECARTRQDTIDAEEDHDKNNYNLFCGNLYYD